MPVDIIVKSKNCDVASRVKEEAVGKVEHATRIYDRLLGVEMVFSEEHNPRIAERATVELTARTKGHHIRAEGTATDHRAATDLAIDRFEAQLRRYKARLVDRSRRRGRVPAGVSGNGQLVGAPAADAPEPDPGPRIVRTKTFELVPMLPDDAAWQLELLGHEFFVFSNVSTGRCSVVYRRKDGDFGLIEAADAS